MKIKQDNQSKKNSHIPDQ